MTQPPDDFESLLTGAVDGSYATALRLTGDSAEAEDLLQEAALNALRGRATFREGTNFGAWFRRILINQSHSSYRRSQRRVSVVAEFDEELGTPSGSIMEALRGATAVDPANAMLARMDAEEIAAALQGLPEAYRVAAVLYFGEDLTYQEISDAVEVPIGTVRSRLHRARRQLKKDLHGLAVSNGIAAPTTLKSILATLPLRSSCRVVVARLDDYLDGEASTADCDLIERHLAVCKRCGPRAAAEREFILRLRTKLKRIPCPQEAQARISRNLMAAMGKGEDVRQSE